MAVDVIEPGDDLVRSLSAMAGIGQLPENVAFRRISEQGTLAGQSLDFIYSWSVFHRIEFEQFPAIVANFCDLLRPGGGALIQIAPLYHSAQGALLGEFGLGNWEHLLLPHEAIRERVLTHPTADAHRKHAAWRYFESQNRITAADVKALFHESGFYLLRHREVFDTDTPPVELLREHSKETLTRNQVVFLFAKA